MLLGEIKSLSLTRMVYDDKDYIELSWNRQKPIPHETNNNYTLFWCEVDERSYYECVV